MIGTNTIKHTQACIIKLSCQFLFVLWYTSYKLFIPGHFFEKQNWEPIRYNNIKNAANISFLKRHYRAAMSPQFNIKIVTCIANILLNNASVLWMLSLKQVQLVARCEKSSRTKKLQRKCNKPNKSIYELIQTRWECDAKCTLLSWVMDFMISEQLKNIPS